MLCLYFFICLAKILYFLYLNRLLSKGHMYLLIKNQEI